MSVPPRYVLIAPFWHNPEHVGRLRIARFVRVLARDGTRVAVVAAGPTRTTVETDWGVELTVPDRWNLCREIRSAGGAADAHTAPRRAPWRRWLHYAFLYPDTSVLWARQAARDAGVRVACRGARWVISSSPPESAHVAGWELAHQLGASFAMDLRDGWLDEPLKPWLDRAGPRRIVEGLLERKLLRAAQRVLVTSTGWQAAIAQRVPEVAEKIAVLTNACPTDAEWPAQVARPLRAPDAALQIVYAGRLSGSSHRRTAEQLVRPFIRETPARSRLPLALTVMGELQPGDSACLQESSAAFGARGWRLDVAPPVDRAAALHRMRLADGLVLLSASTRAIPSKLFDYLAAQRPVLAIMPRLSAVAELTAHLPQVFPAYTDADADNTASVERFLAACAAPASDYPIPESCTEAAHGAQVRALLDG